MLKIHLVRKNKLRSIFDSTSFKKKEKSSSYISLREEILVDIKS